MENTFLSKEQIENLKFKNVGRFSEELSSRYEAKITDELIVRVTQSAYTKEWNATFLTKDLIELDSNENFDYYYSYSKSQTILHVIDSLLNEKGFMEKLHTESINLTLKMAEHKKSMDLRK